MKRIENNVRINYIYQCFRYLDMSTAIWVLYLGFRGMNLVQIGLLESIYHITSLIFEVSSGAVADLLGRKKSIFVGRLCAIISSCIMIISNNFLGFAIGFVICAISNNLGSGTEEALVYDSLKQAGKEEEYIKVDGKSNCIISGVQGIGAFAGVVIAEASFFFSYIAGIGASTLAMITSLFFIEPENNNIHEKVRIKDHFKSSIDCIIENKKVGFLLIFYPMISVFTAIIYFCGQQYFSDLRLSKLQIGLIFLVDSICASTGALLSERIKTRLKSKAGFIVGLSIATSILGFALGTTKISIVMFWMVSLMSASLDPISSQELNELIPAEQRATIISVQNMAFSLMMIGLFPLAGLIAEHINMRVTFIIMSFILVVGLYICYKISQKLKWNMKSMEEMDCK